MEISVSAWKTTTFDHGSFPLTNSHNISCNECHTSGNYQKISAECSSCRQVNYTSAQNPNHAKAGVSNDCKICHSNTTWQASTFNHNTTGFNLTGAHASVIQCSSCHLGNTTNARRDCNSCHKENYISVKEPSHTTAGISEDCKTCHSTTEWKPSSFKHVTTGFELTGAHSAIIQCSSCHLGNTSSAKPECITCHQVQYNNAKGHVDSKFPTDCRLCHNNDNWLDAKFDHSQTSFPLTGSHQTVDCASCHKSGYAGTSTECSSCHLTNYNEATNPNHKTLGLATSCATCHTTNPGWQPASFAIHNFYYALTGAHAAIANTCVACHKGNYSTTPNTCYACHTTDYNNTTNPAHSAAQFPTDCATCHTVNAWAPSTFNHDSQYFPIYSGKHQGQWTKYSECHTSVTNFAAFSCIICHEHSNKTNVDGHHSDVRNYVYNGTSCYTSHPTGRSD